MLKQFFFGPCCLMHSSVFLYKSEKVNIVIFLSFRVCAGGLATLHFIRTISQRIVLRGPFCQLPICEENLSNILPNSHIGPRNSPLPIYCSVSSIGLKVLRGSGHTDTRGPKKTTTLDRANSKIRHS